MFNFDRNKTRGNPAIFLDSFVEVRVGVNFTSSMFQKQCTVLKRLGLLS